MALALTPYSEGTSGSKSAAPWSSLVVQWLEIHLPTQGTQVQSLVWEDSTCCGATKSLHHNY